MTRDDIVRSLSRQSQGLGPVLEARESTVEETGQPFESYKTRVSSRPKKSKRWIATLTLLGAPFALWLSGLLPGWAVNTGDTGIDYVISKVASFGPVLLVEAATIGFVIIILGKHSRHGASPDRAEAGQHESSSV